MPPSILVDTRGAYSWLTQITAKRSEEVGGVGEEEEIAVDEKGPTAEAGEEAGEGKLCALGGAALAPVEASGAEVGLADRADVEGDGGMAEEGAAPHLIGSVPARVVADEDPELIGGGVAGVSVVRAHLMLDEMRERRGRCAVSKERSCGDSEISRSALHKVIINFFYHLNGP